MLDPVALTQQLVRLDTRAGNEKPAAQLLAPLLREAGFTVRIEEGRRNRSGPISWPAREPAPPSP